MDSFEEYVQRYKQDTGITLYNGTRTPKGPKAMSKLPTWYDTATPVVSVEAPKKIDLYNQPPKPRWYIPNNGGPPGFRLADIKAMMDKNDYRFFVKDVTPIGRTDKNEPYIWAIDYVRWVLMDEER